MNNFALNQANDERKAEKKQGGLSERCRSRQMIYVDGESRSKFSICQQATATMALKCIPFALK